MATLDAALLGHLIDCRNCLSSISVDEEITEHDRDYMMSLARKTNLLLPDGHKSEDRMRMDTRA